MFSSHHDKEPDSVKWKLFQSNVQLSFHSTTGTPLNWIGNQIYRASLGCSGRLNVSHKDKAILSSSTFRIYRALATESNLPVRSNTGIGMLCPRSPNGWSREHSRFIGLRPASATGSYHPVHTVLFKDSRRPHSVRQAPRTYFPVCER